MAFDQSTRNRLQKFVSNARAILGEEFTRQLQATYGLDPKQGTVAAIDSLTHLDNRQRQTAHLLRETLAHYLATTPGKGEKDRTKQVLDRIVREQAFTVLNRLAALRMAEARGFLLESIAKAHSSKGFQLYRQLSGTAHGETGDAYRNYLFSLFDEFSLDLAVLFDRHSAQGRLFPRETALLELLAEINHHEIEHLWAEDETIGWIYQYFNSQEERKKMRAESQAPRNSRELAVRNQFFTPRYVVEFLTDNTLGRIWYEMTQGNTALVDSCRYLVRRPTEIFLHDFQTASNLAFRQKRAEWGGSKELHKAINGDLSCLSELDPTIESVIFSRCLPLAICRKLLNDDDLFNSQIGNEILDSIVEQKNHEYKNSIPHVWAALCAYDDNDFSKGYGIDFRRAIWSHLVALTQNSDDVSLSQEELLKQPVYIPHRPLKDPRSIRMLDPACGSMHFGLYAFDLFERIYLEAWQLEQQLGPDAFTREAGQQALQSTFDSLETFKQQIPKLIIEHNIHGVDIDPRAVQIAGLSLWQRAQRAWHQQGIKPQQRPTIVKSNIVCAEPMPGEKALLQEFTSKLNPPVLGQLLDVIFDKMQLAGEAGTLLKIEEEIQTAIYEAREQWLKQSGSNSVGDLFQAKLDAATPQTKLGFDLSGVDDETFWDDAEQRILQALSDYADQAESNADQKRLFAEDAAKGFAFIDLCRKRFDVFLMNPPFGSATKKLDEYLKVNYLDHGHDIINNFLERAENIGTNKRFCGVILSRTLILNERIANFRKSFLLKKNSLSFLVDLGNGVLDAAVDTAALIFKERNSQESTICGDILRVSSDSKGDEVKRFSSLDYEKTYILKSQDFMKVPMGVLCYWIQPWMLELFKGDRLDPDVGVVKKGLITGNDDRFARNHWEVPDQEWSPLFKGGEFSTFYAPLDMKINWKNNGRELRAFAVGKYGSESRTLKNIDYTGRKSIGWGIKNSIGFGVRLIETQNVVYNDNGPAFFPNQENMDERSMFSILSLFNSSLFKVLLRIFQVGERGRYQWLSAHVTLLPKPESIDFRLYEIGKDLTVRFKDIFSLFEETEEFGIEKFRNLYKTLIYNASYFADQIDEIGFLYSELNEIVLRCYQVDTTNFNIVQKFLLGEREKPQNNYKCIVEQLFGTLKVRAISAEFGILIGRWGDKNLAGILSYENVELLEIAASEHYFENTSDFQSYMVKPSGFFDEHLGIYSANKRHAPIYWPLQTPSGSYTVWVYYHRLNEQTLYTCVNDFVEPKLEQVEQDLNGLRGKSARSSQEEKELEKLSDLASELRDFRDELLRLAKFWKPNLNDGVQITAAPLWKLFQHRVWQKKLKATWESLEKGDYDWAHLACSIWPERVLRKCHQDRSLAIAHDVEDHFWYEVEVPVKRGKKLTGETKLEWQPKDLSEAELNALVKKLAAEVKQ